MGKINKFSVLRVLYTIMALFCIMFGFFITDDIETLGFCFLMTILSSVAILVTNQAEDDFNESI
jgi:Na+/proline symporter